MNECLRKDFLEFTYQRSMKVVIQLVCKQCPQTMKYACSSGRGPYIYVVYVFIHTHTHTHTHKSTCQWRVTKLNRGVTDWVLRNLTFRDWHVGDILEGASRGGAAVVNVWGRGRVEGRAGERREGEGKEGEVEGREGRGGEKVGRGEVEWWCSCSEGLSQPCGQLWYWTDFYIL